MRVVVTTTGRAGEMAATRASLDRQTDLAHEVLVVEDVASLCRAVDDGTAPLITIVRAGTVLLPGALRALHEVMAGDPTIGVVDALSVPTDADGRLNRVVVHAHTRAIRRRFRPAKGDRHPLVARRLLDLAAPTFRRDLVRSADLRHAPSLDAAVRLAVKRVVDRGAAWRIPEVWCGQPTPERRALPSWHSVQQRLTHAFEDVRMSRRWGPIRRWPRLYEMLATRVTRGSLDTVRASPRRVRAQRLAYVLWRYPVPHETFIRREIEALRQAGIPLEVFALEPDGAPSAPDPSAAADPVIYFGAGHASLLRWLRRRPWIVFRLWLFIVGHRHDARVKTWWGDRDLLRIAARLASMLERHRITHVHAPWANRYTIIASVAARMIGATFSVQARASEIHRALETTAIPDRLRFAEFVITNSRYNEHYLREVLPSSGRPPIHVVYNGVELSRLSPVIDVERAPGPCRLLAVGRLIEPKGFRVLLQACALLRERGLSFACEIIGAPQPGHTATWVDLRMLHTGLGLESTVTFRGGQPFSRVLEAYRRADVFVLPCVRARDGSHDITPNSLIEAMAVGLPVVSTVSGAIPEIVDHERDGLLVAPGNVRALADALERLVRDAALRRELGEAARKKVEERFDIDRNTVQRVALFEGLAR